MPGRRQRLTRLTSAPFRVRAPGPISGQLCGTRPGRGPDVVPVPQRRVRLLQGGDQLRIRRRPRPGHPAMITDPARFARRSRSASAFLTVGLPTRQTRSGRTGTGLPRSTRMRRDRIGCPNYPGTAVLSRPTLNHRPPPAASQRPVLHPDFAFHIPGLNVTGHKGIHSRSPQPVFPQGPGKIT